MIGTIAVVAACSAAWVQPEGLEARLERLDARLAKIKDVRAKFEQRKRTKLLKRPMESGGKVSAKGAVVKWETLRPRAMTMLVSETAVKVYYPDDRLLEEYPLDERYRQAAIGPIPRLSALKERFEVKSIDAASLTDEKDTASLLALELTPKGQELRKHVAWVRVLIDEGAPCAKRVIVRDPDGDETEIAFSSVELDRGMEAGELELKVPEGTKVVKPSGH
jgi:outer membrane lipoprotein-sorting protein